MDITTIVVVVAMVSTFLVAIVWMEIKSQKTGSKKRHRDGKSSESDEKQNVIYQNS